MDESGFVGFGGMEQIAWSPDSKDFIYGQNVVLSFDKPSLDGGINPRWVDSQHFMYYYFNRPEINPANQQIKGLIAEIRGDEVSYYELRFSYTGFYTIKPKQ